MRLFYTAFLLEFAVVYGHNLSCYQCERNTPGALCGPESLLSCGPNKDRCVTHVSRDATNGYSIKRECGLGPCTFEDEMISRGLGIFGTCDTSKDEFFCVSCCKISGCNYDVASSLVPSLLLLLLVCAVTLLLTETI